jgi:isoprenylcysteine carboxyl methyltransferase (ICMT) family protein YpbQ
LELLRNYLIVKINIFLLAGARHGCALQLFVSGLPGFIFNLFSERFRCLIVEKLARRWVVMILLLDDKLVVPCFARTLVVVKAGH